jgi:hypothetical protein
MTKEQELQRLEEAALIYQPECPKMTKDSMETDLTWALRDRGEHKAADEIVRLRRQVRDLNGRLQRVSHADFVAGKLRELGVDRIADDEDGIKR